MNITFGVSQKKMTMERGHLEPVVERGAHDGVHLILGQHHVAACGPAAPRSTPSTGRSSSAGAGERELAAKSALRRN
jgi:hypothetical protein